MLDYQKQDADTGIDDVDSIQPYDNAEDADQSVLRRTPENIRNRTEVVRRVLDEMRAVAALDRAMTIVATPEATVAWGGALDVDLSGFGTGIPTLNAPAGPGSSAQAGIAVQSFLSNAKRLDAGGAAVIGDTAIMPALARTHSGPPSGTLTFTSEKRPWENGNNIYIRAYDSGVAQSPKAIFTVAGTLDGSGNPAGPVTIEISLSNGGSGIDATQQDVIDELAGTAATLVNIATTNAAAAAPVIEDVVDSNKGRPLEGGVDSESFTILENNWNAFFTGTDRLNEGDVLVFTFPDAEARRKQGGSPESTLRVIRNSENVDNSNVIPICKVIQDGLIFMNGTGLERGQTVKLLPDQSLRNDLAEDTLPDTGDKLVGADAKAGSPTTLAQGTVYSQMVTALGALNSLNGEYDAHVVGSADRHTLSQIDDKFLAQLTGKPFVVVSATANEGDYTTIQAAIDAIAADVTMAGTVYIKYKASGYTEGLSFTGLGGRSITLIGEDRERVVVAATGSTPALTVSAMDAFDSIEFINLNFTTGLTGPSQHIEITADMPYDRQKIVFRGCHMRRNASLTPRMLYVTGAPRIEFHECLLDGNAYDNTTGWGDVNSDDGPTITIHNCRVANAQSLLVYKSTGSDPGHLSFCQNDIYRCGYNKSDGTTLTAILHAETIGTAFQSIRVCRNIWRDNETAGPNENSGALVHLNGDGIVSGNVLKQKVYYAPNTYNAIIFGSGFVIEGNYSEPGKCSAFQGNMSIANNVIYDFEGGAANAPAITGGIGAAVRGNKINCSTSTAPVCDEIVDLGSNCSAEGNIVEDAPAKVVFRLGNFNCAKGNDITFNAEGTGIRAESTYSSVSDNVINDAAIGVQVLGDYTSVTGNRVRKPSGGVGIQVDSGADGCTVTGNAVRGVAVAGTGILAEADFGVINGNSVSECSPGIHVTGDSNAIAGNMVHNVTAGTSCLIDGSNNALSGNRFRAPSSTPFTDNGSNNGISSDNSVTTPVISNKYDNILNS